MKLHLPCLTPIHWARAFGVASAALLVLASLPLEPPALVAQIIALAGLDLLVVLSLTRRRNRFPGAVWLGATALGLIPLVVDRNPGDNVLICAVLLRAAAMSALLWPRRPAASDHDPLPALPLTWAWASVLVIAVALTGVVRIGGIEGGTPIGVAAVGSIVFFSLFAVLSWSCSARWLAVPVIGGLAALAADNLSELRGDDTRRWILILAPMIFAVAFDWLRSPVTALERFLRTTAAVFAGAMALPLAAAPHQALAVRPFAAALIWSAAFGVSAAIAPRIAARRFSMVTSRPPRGSPRRTPRWRGLALPAAVAVALPLLALVPGKDPDLVISFGLFGAVAMALLVTRVRGLRVLSVSALAITSGTLALASMKHGALPGLALAGPVVIWLLARWMSTAGAWAAPRRMRIRFDPAPRASLALGAIGVAVAGAILVHGVRQDDSPWRAIAVSDLLAPIPVIDAGLSSPPERPRASTQTAQAASAIAIDPLGRGTWIIDEERDQVALIDDLGGRTSYDVGGWPEQIAVDASGRAYVSCRQSGTLEVIERDGTQYAVEVGAEPRGLALGENERQIYVGLVTERAVVALDTATLARTARLELDVEPRVLARMGDGDIAILPGRGAEVIFADARLDHADHVPLYAGSRTAWHGQALVPVGDDLIVIHSAVDTGLSHPTPSGGYGGGTRDPVETLVAVLRDRRPAVHPLGASLAFALRGAADITGAAWFHDRLTISSRGTAQLIEVSLEQLGERKILTTGAGLNGLALARDGTIRSLAAFDRKLLLAQGDAAQPIAIGPGRLSDEVALGRALFHRTDDQRLSDAGLACATCHPDGREDGLVWRLQGTRRQTPLLAARLSDTAPFNWEGTAPTLTQNIRQTVERLGGQGLSEPEAEAIAAYLVQGLRAPVVPRTVDPALVAEGERVFTNSEVGCNRCHDQESAFTDGSVYDVESMSPVELAEMREVDGNAKPPELNVPSLRYLALTAPYFHDGSVKTLEELIASNQDRMGNTESLSPRERRALVAYLRSL